MNNEIKEILDNLKYTAKKHTIQVLENSGKIERCPQEIATEMRLNSYSANILLDYITNLQQKIKHYEETTTFGDYVKEVNLLVDYKSRIEKAVEYIMSELVDEWSIKNDGCVSGSDLPVNAITPILDILNGRSDE